jgi:hypothetical protein
MLESYQEDCATTLLQEAVAVKQKLAERHEETRLEQANQTSQKLLARQDKFKREYATRVAHEKKMELQYLEQLQDFWAGRPEAEAEIEQAMFPLRKKMDQGHWAWQKWRDGQLEVYKQKLADDVSLKEELIYSQTERLKDSCDDRETEQTRRMLAEKKWWQEVVWERERLLGSWEVSEMEGDADSLFAREGSQDSRPEGTV